MSSSGPPQMPFTNTKTQDIFNTRSNTSHKIKSANSLNLASNNSSEGYPGQFPQDNQLYNIYMTNANKNY